MVIRTASIRGRLLWHMSLLFSGGLVVLYWAASNYATYAADRSYDRLLTGSAVSIAETLAITQNKASVDIPYAALDMLAAAPNDKVFYRVAGLEGETVTGYDDLPPPVSLTGTMLADQEMRFFNAPYRGEPVRFVIIGREVRMGGQTGWIRIQVGQTLEARSALANELTLSALVPIVLLTVLAGVIVWFTVARAVHPLEKVGADLAARRPSDLSPIDENRVPSEIGPLIIAMNQFMGRLDSNIGLLRMFIANVAHQLRTPLTAMIVQLRLAQTAQGGAARASALAASQSAERLSRLVDQLLSDALVMHRSDEKHLDQFDLRISVEQALQMASQGVWESDVRFTSSVTEAMYAGDEVMICEAIKNVVHNALTHGDSPSGVIEIHLTRKIGGYCLQVSDSGPGVADDILADVGARFKTSRSLHGGAGLGLAIVNQVVKSHGGRLGLCNRPGGGLRVEMWLPRQ